VHACGRDCRETGGAEGATAPETLRQRDRSCVDTLESALPQGGATEGVSRCRSCDMQAKLSGYPTEGVLDNALHRAAHLFVRDLI